MRRTRERKLSLKAIGGIKRIAESNRELLATWACRAALGIEDSHGENPLLEWKDGKPRALTSDYREVAWLLLERLTGVLRPEKRRIEGFLCLLDWFFADMARMKDLDSAAFDRARNHRQREKLVEDFLWVQVAEMEDCAQCLLGHIYHGVPLYRWNESGTELEWVPYSDDDYIYLSKKGQYTERVELDEVPPWATAYYIRMEHLEVEDIIFGMHSWDMPAAEVAVRREAFRKHIGLPTPARSDGTLGSRSQNSLLDLIPKVIDKYYGASYDPTNPHTWTKQIVLMDWLMRKFNISEREAAAIDIVTRPNHARRKSR